MAKDETKSFPMLPVKHWWSLRKKFKQSIPGVVTANYIATVLDMQVKSASLNVLPYLKTFELIDDDGKTLELTKRWRDDKQYPDVCKELKNKHYPEELIQAVPNPSEDREAISRWFANYTGKGEVAVRKMSAIYILISEAKIPIETISKSSNSQKPIKKEINKTAVKEKAPKNVSSKIQQKQDQTPKQERLPDININLQIHISSDASPDQIDKIFESMAKHVYKNKLQ
ncbi:MAG: DUF5343 domain-containing protein [Deltaproteobacteria bacterium]|nr:DUF5343 domain-containing protein [Deltaproteobacteria bacterium]